MKMVNKSLSKKTAIAALLCSVVGMQSAFAEVPKAVKWGEYEDYQYYFGGDPDYGFVTIRIWEPGTDVYYPYNEKDDNSKT